MRTTSQTTPSRTYRIKFWILSLGLVAGASAPVLAEDSIALRPPVQICSVGRSVNASSQCYVITHGMGGTVSGDRFQQLAKAICVRLPQSAVLLVDWSEKASAKIGRFPNPYKVAGSIDDVGDQAAVALKKEGVDPARTTFIGESFGNWVNARIAHRLGGVQGILALNPAHEGAGYSPPDLRRHARHSWSFHTYSIFDTTREIASNDFWLETPAEASHWAQHVWGIAWLRSRLEADDTSWLSLDKPLPERREGYFRASATMNGQLSDKQPTRARPVPAEAGDSPANLITTGVAVTLE